MKYLIFLFSLFIPFFSIGQTAQDSAELRVLVDSAYNKLYENPDSAREFAYRVMELAKEKGLISYELNALQTIGYSYYDQYNFDKAIEIFQEGLDKSIEKKFPDAISNFHSSLAMAHEQLGEFRLAFNHYLRALENNKLRKDTVGIGINLGNLALSMEALGKIDSAILLQKQAIELREKRKNPNVHYNYNNLGTIYHQNGRYDLAIELYLKAVEKRHELGEKRMEADTYGNLGALFSSLNNSDKCLFYLKKAEGIYLETDYKTGLANNYSLQAVEHKRIKSYKIAEEKFKQSLQLQKDVNNLQGQVNDIHNLGSLYSEWGQIDRAIPYYEEALKLKIESEIEGSMPITLVGLGNAWSKKGAYKKAEEMLLKANQMAEDQGNLLELQNATNKLAEHYERVGNLSQAIKYQRLTNSLKDSTFNKDYISKMNQLYVAFETEQTKGELLDEQLKSQELEKAKAESDLKIAQLLAVLGGLVIILLGGAFIFYRNKQKEKEKIAKIKIREQQKGLDAVIYAQEEERKRIAKDLHDGIVQQLGGLKLGLQKVLAPTDDPDAKKMIKILDDSAQELRELSHRMMPKALSDLGLVPALRDMLDNSLTHSDINFEFEIFGVSDTDRFEERIEISLYRIVQELINNVIKHSDANTVSIQLMKTQNRLALIVEDNGKGFNTKKSKSGIGLMNISSRLDTLNGQVNFEPSPEGGTLATINIPLNND